MKLKGKTVIVFLLIFWIGISVRFFGIEKESLWLDEYYSLQHSRGDVPDIINVVKDRVHPPLYFLLLNYWTRVFGTTEWGLRSFSAFIGALTIFLFFLTARSIVRENAGLISSLIFTLVPFHVYYSQEARMYSLFVFVTMACIYFTVKILDSRTHYYLFFLFIFEIATLYTHYYGMFVVATLNIFMAYLIFFRRENVGIFWPWLIVQIAVLIVFIPWISILIKQMEGRKVTSYSVTFVRHSFLLNDAFGYFFSKGFPRIKYSGILVSLIAKGIFLGVVFGAFSLKKNKRLKYRLYINKDKHHLLLITFLIVPMLLVFITGQYIRIYNTRSLIISLIPICLLLELGISKFRFRSQLVILASYIFVTALCIYNLYQNPQKEQWRETARYIKDNSQVGDIAVVCAAIVKDVFDHYLEGQVSSIGIKRTLMGNELKTLIGRILTDHQRIWLVLSHEAESPIKKYMVNENNKTILLKHASFIRIDIYLIKAINMK